MNLDSNNHGFMAIGKTGLDNESLFNDARNGDLDVMCDLYNICNLMNLEFDDSEMNSLMNLKHKKNKKKGFNPFSKKNMRKAKNTLRKAGNTMNKVS
jgi:hypothetical protein